MRIWGWLAQEITRYGKGSISGARIPVMLSSFLGVVFFYYTVWKCAMSIDDLYVYLNRLDRKMKDLAD